MPFLFCDVAHFILCFFLTEDQRTAQRMGIPPLRPALDVGIPQPRRYFLRLSAKKPRASFSISFARFSSEFSFSSSSIRRSFSSVGSRLCPLPTNAWLPRAFRAARQSASVQYGIPQLCCRLFHTDIVRQSYRFFLEALFVCRHPSHLPVVSIVSLLGEFCDCTRMISLQSSYLGLLPIALVL